jgi:CBS domain-containing protein
VPAADYELTAGDLMTIDPVVVAVDAPIEEAERLILVHGVSGLPVVDEDGTLLGVVSQTDFMHLANPDVRALLHHKASGIRVGEVMSRPAVTVELSTPLVEAARRMVTERVHRVVVVDDDHRPIGVLSAMNFVNLLADGGVGHRQAI